MNYKCNIKSDVIVQYKGYGSFIAINHIIVTFQRKMRRDTEFYFIYFRILFNHNDLTTETECIAQPIRQRQEIQSTVSTKAHCGTNGGRSLG